MNIKFSPPDIGELEIQNVVEVLKSGWITTGSKTKLFERKIAEYCGTSRAACLNSATAGLELILKILGIGAGDEVITSAYTYTASASVIEHVGAKIVLCDTAKDSYEMDYDKLAQLINSRTKAIIAVDIAGKIADYTRIYDVINAFDGQFEFKSDIMKQLGRIAVIADAAHSFGAVHNGQKSGQIADFTSFSFHAVKNLTTAEGGAVTWRDINGIENEWIYNQFMLWSLHGQSKDALAKTRVGAWEYDIEILGHKCNMTDIMAGIGLAQLERYGSILARRKEIIGMYDTAFKDLPIQRVQHYTNMSDSSGHLYLTRVDGLSEEQRNTVIIKMAERGIATNVHYKPLPMHTAYKSLGFDIAQYPNAYAQYKNEITLPLHTLLSDDEVNYVIDNYIKTIKEIIVYE